jgi:hypothetical protein
MTEEKEYREGCDPDPVVKDEQEMEQDTDHDQVPPDREEPKSGAIPSDGEASSVVSGPEDADTAKIPPGAAEDVPSTAFIVMMYPNGRLEIATSIPNLKMDHPPTFREIRDISHSLYDDMVATLNSKALAREVLGALTQAAVGQQRNQQRIQVPQKQVLRGIHRGGR